MIELNFPKELITAEINDRLEIHRGWSASMFKAGVNNIVRDIKMNNECTAYWMAQPVKWQRRNPLEQYLRVKRANTSSDVGLFDTLNSIFHSIYCVYLHAFRMSYLGLDTWVWKRDSNDPANAEMNAMLYAIPESFIIEAQQEAVKYAEGFFKALYGVVSTDLANDAKKAIAQARSENPMWFK